MKFLIIFAVAVLCITGAYAQDVVNLKDLKTPNSPGFQILDISPSNVERPTNPEEFSVKVLNLFSNGNGLPKNFAFEFAPFWIFKPKNETVSRYLGIPTKKGGFFRPSLGELKKFSISIASAFSDSTTGSTLKNTNYMAAGARTNLLTIRTDKQAQKIQAARVGAAVILSSKSATKPDGLAPDKVYSRQLANEAASQAEHDWDAKADIRNAERDAQKIMDAKAALAPKPIDKLPQQPETPENDNACARVGDIKRLMIENKKEEKKKREREIPRPSLDEIDKLLDDDQDYQSLMAVITKPPLLQLDAAGAYSVAFADNKYSNRRFHKAGIWTTLTINVQLPEEKMAESFISFILLGRYTNDNILADTAKLVFQNSNAFDYGGKLECNLKRFNLSVEYVKRNYKGLSAIDTERTVGILQYKINDKLYVMGTYGKNFGNINNVFALLGLNWGFGSSPLKNE